MAESVLMNFRFTKMYSHTSFIELCPSAGLGLPISHSPGSCNRVRQYGLQSGRTLIWKIQGGQDVQPLSQMGHDTYLSPISGYKPDGHHRDVTASWNIPVVYVIIEQLQEKIKLIEEELIELRNMRSMNDTSRQCTASCHHLAMSGLQAGSLIIIKSLQHKIQRLEEEL